MKEFKVWLTEDYEGLYKGTCINVTDEDEEDYIGIASFMATTFTVNVPKSICVHAKEDLLGLNYTKPNEENHEDKPEDWLACSLVFTRALGILLEEETGIVIKLVGDMQLLMPGIEKVIVANIDDQVKIIKCEEDIPEGTKVRNIKLKDE